MLSRFGAEILAAGAEVDGFERVATPPAGQDSPTESSMKFTERDRLQEANRHCREERFQQAEDLTDRVFSCRGNARRLGLSVKVVLRYRRLDRCPDWEPGRMAPTQLDAFASVITDWITAGHRNSADLNRLLKAHGYRGGYDAVRRYLNRRIGGSMRPARRNYCETHPPNRKPPSARKLSFRLVNPKPESRSARVLERLRACHPKLKEA